MATQWITVVKLGGMAADVILPRIRSWANARQSDDPNEWGGHQWPPEIRAAADVFAERLCANSAVLPVLYFNKWVDLWSMGDLFAQWLTPPDGPLPLTVHADRCSLFAYALPDGGRLAAHLASAGRQQFDESEWFLARLREAVSAWHKLTDRSVLVVLRNTLGAYVSDDEVIASLRSVPAWLDESKPPVGPRE